MKAPFFRVTKSAAYGLEKDTALRSSVREWRAGSEGVMVYAVDAREFAKLDESPFAYWVPADVRTLLPELPQLQPTHAQVCQGVATGDDPRFLRLWFEVKPEAIARTKEETFKGRRWVGFAKGGTFAPFFSDIALVINWADDGAEAKTFASGQDGGQHWTRDLKNTQYNFRAGLTYPRRSGIFNVRALPAGMCFGTDGPGIYVDGDDHGKLLSLLGFLNSAMAIYLQALSVPEADATSGSGRKRREVGSVQKLRAPEVLSDLAELSGELLNLYRRAAKFREVTHDFIAPLLAQATGSLSTTWNAEFAYRTHEHQRRVLDLKAELDNRVFDLYSIAGADRTVLITDVSQAGIKADVSGDAPSDDDEYDGGTENEEIVDPYVSREGAQTAAEALLSYAIGCAFGRWDVRIGRDRSCAPPRGGPFAVLPRCSPGMLVDPDGLPARVAPAEYLIDVQADGVLVDDKDHPRDLGRRIRDAFVALYGEAADERLAEALSMIDAPEGDLRAWLRTRFFERVHRPMYTMGGNPPRRAPIYWPIYVKGKGKQTSFGVWLYYPRLSHESLFTVARLFKERREAELAALSRLTDVSAKAEGSVARAAKDARAQSEDLVRGLAELEAEALRVATLRVVPEFDDGVLLNCAVLHNLVAWADAKAAWTRFQDGAFDWSKVARKLRPVKAEEFRARELALADAAPSKTKKVKSNGKKGSQR